MANEFDAIAQRAAALRLTVPELVDQVEGVSRATYWRAKKGHVGISAQVRVLRAIEARLDALEAKRLAAMA